MSKETRAGAPVEIRADDEGVRVTGHAAVFDEWADIGGFFLERVAPGAFDGRLGDDVQFLVNHHGLPLARTTSGTLSLSIDARGLKMETSLDPSDPDAARIIPKLRRGDLSKMSFAFEVEKEEWDDAGEIPRRTITKFKRLHDVAVVNVPAYGGTEIGLRSLEQFRGGNSEASAAAALARMRMGLRLDAES